MYIIDEREQEYNRMYSYVMRNSNRMLLTTDEIIEYLVCQCYYIESYNDELEEIISKIKSVLGIKHTEETNQIIDVFNNLPF